MHTPFIKTLPWLYTPPHIIIHKCIVQGMARSTQDKLMCTGKHRPYIKTLGMAGWHIYIYIYTCTRTVQKYLGRGGHQMEIATLQSCILQHMTVIYSSREMCCDSMQLLT